MKLTDEILFEAEDGLAVITIDRPQQRNAINRGVNEGLRKAFDLFEKDASLRVGILTGSGEKAFCAGMDLKEAAALQLHVTPSDASVYLDGTFVGTAAQVNGANGMVVPPGNHRIEVVRPGYQPEHVDFDSAPGERVSLNVDLEED